MLDMHANKWNRVADLPHPIVYPAAVTMPDDTVYCIGGTSVHVLKYLFRTNEWIRLAMRLDVSR